jgi:hypothetical protein
MQIICNHCGNQLSFPDYQNLVTCNHCATHLQIEETERTYSVEVIQKELFNNLISETSSFVIEDAFKVLRSKYQLELNYQKKVNQLSFYSIIEMKIGRTSLFRGVYRFFTSVLIFSLIFYTNFSDFSNLILAIYAIVIFLAGCLETYWWIKLRRFEKLYLIENQFIKYQNIDLETQKWMDEFDKLDERLVEIKEEFFYPKIGIKFPVGRPSKSNGLRIFTLIIPVIILTILIVSQSYIFFGENSIIILLFMFALLFLLLGVSVIGETSYFKKSYGEYISDREQLLSKLEKEIEL